MRFVMQDETEIDTIGIRLKTRLYLLMHVTHPPQFDLKVIDACTFKLCRTITIVRTVKRYFKVEEFSIISLKAPCGALPAVTFEGSDPCIRKTCYINLNVYCWTSQTISSQYKYEEQSVTH